MEFQISRWKNRSLIEGLKILEEEGIEFKCGVHVGIDIKADTLKKEYDAVSYYVGEQPYGENLPIKGSDLNGVVQAMDFLGQNNKRVDGIKGPW